MDIEARRGKELLEALKRSRRRFDVIAVRCFSKEVARQAAKDDRVDILLFPDDPAQRKHNWLDHHEAELVEGTGRAYEVNASDLLATSPTHLAKVITQIKRDLAVATKHDIPIVLSSGATTPLAMREPKALTALASLLDIDEEYAIDMISTIPEAIIERNRAKLKEEELMMPVRGIRRRYLLFNVAGKHSPMRRRSGRRSGTLYSPSTARRDSPS